MTNYRIGFIGLGDIGAPMAMRIHRAGHSLQVFNRTPAKAEPFQAEGIPVSSDAAELASQTDIVLLSVYDARSVEDVVFGPRGVAEGAREGMLVVDLSTIDPSKAQAFAKRLKQERGVDWVDAPVSGGAVGARAGTLAVMAGGRSEDVERARPVLESFAGSVTHMGPLGCGMAMKACNQMLSYGTGAVIAETLNMAARFGMDPGLVIKAVAGGFADSKVLSHFGPQMIAGTYGGSSLTAIKDIDIVLELSRATGSAIPVTSVVTALFRMAVANGHVDGGLATPMRLYADGPLEISDRLQSPE